MTSGKKSSSHGLLEYLKTYSLSKSVKQLLEEINPLLVKKETNIRIHLDALRNSYITEEEYQTIEAKIKLGQLCINLEEIIPDSRAALIFFDEGENKLYHGAAPNVPCCFFEIFEEINQNNMFGPTTGSCGLAVYNRTVISTDVSTNPCWEQFREHLLSFGVLSAWSIPFYDESRVIGTLSIYLSQRRSATKREVMLIKNKIREFEWSILLLSKDYLKFEA